MSINLENRLMTEEKRFDPNEHYAVEMQPPPAFTHHIRRRYLDIPYANLSLSQKLDIYLPDEGAYETIATASLTHSDTLPTRYRYWKTSLSG